MLQKLSERHSHKPVLLEDALLNDAPLRARLVHVAAQHGVRLVHPGVVKVLNLAAEALLTRLLKDMMHAAALRSKQAKDVPGMAKDVDRNWAREVRGALVVWLRLIKPPLQDSGYVSARNPRVIGISMQLAVSSGTVGRAVGLAKQGVSRVLHKQRAGGNLCKRGCNFMQQAGGSLCERGAPAGGDHRHGRARDRGARAH